MEAIILAGGKGTRLSSIVNDRPKPLADVGNRPLLEIIMELLRGKGITHFVLSTGYKSEMIESHFGDNFKSVPISYAKEIEPLGTGGALMNSRQKINATAPFLLVNGDTLFDANISSLAKAHTKATADVSVSLFKADQDDRYGFVKVDNSNNISEIGARKAAVGQPAIAGTFIISFEALNNLSIPDGFFPLEAGVFKTILDAGGRLLGIMSESSPIDIGTPRDYLYLQNTYNQ